MTNNIDLRQFSGVMNLDDPFATIAQGQHVYAKNVVYRGMPGNMRGQSARGTRLIVNDLLPVAGNNQSIGAFYDDLKKRIYWFNYNSAGSHGIYVYYLRTGAIDRIAEVGINTDGDIFDFNLDNPIYAVKMLYGDATQGDALYFNNSRKEPCQINVTLALTGGYGTIQRSFIDVAKEPPAIPPSVVYEDDATITVNNLRKKLFKFKVRWVFDGKEKSVTSSESELPLPSNYTDTNIDKDPTKNCRIAIVYQTGKPNVKKIELLAAVTGRSDENGVIDPNDFGDFFTIATIDKLADSIPDNDIAVFRFFNNQAYIPIDVKESTQLFDLVPLEANDIEFLNGNTPIYGGIKEGYDLVPLTATTTSTSEVEQTTQPPFLFAVSQSGDSGFGTGSIHAIVIGTISTGKTFDVFTTHEVVSYLSIGGDDASDVIAGLAAAAISVGFTVVSSDAENLYISKTGEILERSIVSGSLIAASDSFAYDWNSRYSWGVIYFDAKGRTNGVVTNLNVPVQTVNYTETTGAPNIPKILLSITSRPPIWATYYQIVRTKNLSKSDFLYWVSDRTFKDKDFAYIGIENLNVFIKDNPTSNFLAYSFSPGDRIRFIKVLSGSVNTIYVNQDFEIQGQLFSPEINGTVEPGQYLKIALPTTSGTFDFGTNDFFSYELQLYTPAQSVSGGLDLYYEFGERYAIGDAGLTTRFHQGMTQNQTSDLVSPATFEFTKGDDYYRHRTINTGGDLNYVITAGERGAGRHTMGVNYVDQTFIDANITTGNSPLQNLTGWTFASNTRALIKMGASSGLYTFRVRTVIKVNFLTDDNSFSYFFQDNTGAITYGVTPQFLSAGDHTFSVDCTFQLNSSQFISFLGYSDADLTDSKTYSQTDLRITIQNPYTIGIIDEHFSDYFQSKVNSNGREWIVEADAAQVYNPTLLRWGLSNIINTNINQTNRFYPLNFDEIDRTKGDIQRLVARERILRVFQSKGVGEMGVYSKFLQDSGTTNIVSTTDEIITKNNIQYYKGEYGLGDQVTSLVSTTKADYFVYPSTGEQIRLAGDGMTVISLLYKGEYYLKNLLTPYNKVWNRTEGGKSKILGCFDYFEGQCVNFLQSGAIDSAAILPYAFAFHEGRNAYSAFFDMYPEWVVASEDKVALWSAGELYIQDNETLFANYFGVQYFPRIDLVFNKDVVIKKTFNAIGYESNQIWESPTNGDVKTSDPNQQTGLDQISQLRIRDYETNEGLRYAAFLRDANSMSNAVTALLEGDYLKGNWLYVSLIYRGSDFGWIFVPYINYSPSPRNL